VVEVQETAQSFATSDNTLPRRNLEIASNQGIPQPLMVPLVMVVTRVFRDGRSQMSLSQRYDPVKALTLNRKHKSLCESVQIRTPRRQRHYLHATPLQDSPERLRVQRVPIQQHIPLAKQELFLGVGQVASHLLHPWTVRISPNPCDLHSSAPDIDHEAHAKNCKGSGKIDPLGSALLLLTGAFYTFPRRRKRCAWRPNHREFRRSWPAQFWCQTGYGGNGVEITFPNAGPDGGRP
jgi:hypothetical protein